ncbi:RdRP-domain-containing protein [Fomes fomentarius]|nr:RdRP-domain-containing protein [Fomes fomentarius]
MEVFITKIPDTVSNNRLKLDLANVLHLPPLREPTEPPINFEVFVFQNRRKRGSRLGALTLPYSNIAHRFLQLYWEPTPQRPFVIGTTRIQFRESRNPARPEVLNRLRTAPFQDPREAHERETRNQELHALHVGISSIQFGWECRDQAYSIEWEQACSQARLTFDGKQREFWVSMHESEASDSNQDERRNDTQSASDADPLGFIMSLDFMRGIFTSDVTRLIVIRVSQIYWVSASLHELSGRPVVFFSLIYPPSFQSESTSLFGFGDTPQRQRWTCFTDDHAEVAAYTSLSLRLECESPADLINLREFARHAHIKVSDFSYAIVERRGLFSQARRLQYADWVATLPWSVAFQVEALVRSWLVHLEEILSLRRPIQQLLLRKGHRYTAALPRDLYSHAKALYWFGDTSDELDGDSDVANGPPSSSDVSHAITKLFAKDENKLQFRFDRDVNGRSFINRRVKKVLLDGLTIAGVHFTFLAYSQSALKDHAVWFVTPFEHIDDSGNHHLVNAASIIASIGNFRDLPFDRQLIYCPARYAARISMAFTATEASVSVEVDQVMTGDDIKDKTGTYTFTDGVGTISPELAKEVWKALQERRGRTGRKDRTYPRGYQVRFQGSKGMLSVDYTLTGRRILLRPSMIKFEAPHSTTIEIARAFHRPAPYYLNRPPIMLLEGLGVPQEVFQTLQDDAVRDAQASVLSLESAAHLLDTHGLGASFRLGSVMLGLYKLGVGPPEDAFWRQMMDFAINHVLREMKYRARIPVPGPDSWTLVGVADVHGYLLEGEVFACIDSPHESDLIYLEGRVLVSRSPTIHPGDVQVVHAIGRPPPDSPFARESLRNTIVFSIQGERPLPSCLGGGDLDGDEYNVTTRPELLPPSDCLPASYEPAQRKLVDHESTMADVAEFVAEYINSDTLGIIATTWLIIADQSTEGIFDPDCLKLAALHSNAVDYPKSGQPVPNDQIPRLKYQQRPDWTAPETGSREGVSYDQSTRAIGKLFRSIELPALQRAERGARRQRRKMQHGNRDEQLGDILEYFYEEPDEADPMDEVTKAILARVADFIPAEKNDDKMITGIWECYGAYVSTLRSICADYTLSQSRFAMLTEAEAEVGTIVAKCSQPRKRKDLMSQMREQTATLVGNVKREISGDNDVLPEMSLQRAWTAYRLSRFKDDDFGARSFGWIVLGCIFDAIKEIEVEEEEAERTSTRRI